MDFNAVIAEATSVAEPAPASTEALTVETEQETTAPEPVEDIGKKPDSELTPEQLEKREANRRSHENSRAARLKRENRELQAQLAQLRQTQPASQPSSNRPVRPRTENFSDWDLLEAAQDKYVEELADWKLEQKLNARDTKAQESTQAENAQAQTLQRGNEIAAQEAEFAKANPEYTALYKEHSDESGNIPFSAEVATALMEADDATLALYVLMKEGRLFDLDGMSPYKLAIEIGKAEERGQSYINRNKATNAPTPVRAARGTGEASKSLANQSVEELMKRFNRR